jgi:hypothetical protein
MLYARKRKKEKKKKEGKKKKKTFESRKCEQSCVFLRRSGVEGWTRSGRV